MEICGPREWAQLLEVKEIDRHLNVSSFHAGPEEWSRDLTEFLQDDALYHQEESHATSTYVFFLGDLVAGYVSLAMDSILRHKELQRKPGLYRSFKFIPVLLIGQLAVHCELRGLGLATAMMDWVQAKAIDSGIGCRFLGLAVDQENERAQGFYRKYGFIEWAQLAQKVRQGQVFMLYDLYGQAE